MGVGPSSEAACEEHAEAEEEATLLAATGGGLHHSLTGHVNEGSLVNAGTSALNGNIHGQQIKDQMQTLTEAGGQVDYVEIVQQESLTPVERIDHPAAICVAAWSGKVRVIDNIEIQAAPS
ncbi:pantoate--beta-alanine ligase [Panicum miliaceum]|uniref:Pantoate--beta-alanine ligase n=2 Tax=Panicum sect. Panicum TaxID=2100772 RepID=A0A3L6SEX8_PANMI|nr:pantoate--beta-alanine ligase [Panicum miliaceum]